MQLTRTIEEAYNLTERNLIRGAWWFLSHRIVIILSVFDSVRVNASAKKQPSMILGYYIRRQKGEEKEK